MSRNNSDITNTDDDDHLDKVAAGDETAFAGLLRKYRRRVFYHTLTFALTYQEAEEITQDIFIGIWQHRQDLGKIRKFEDYLFIISRNHLISYIRSRVIHATAPAAETLVEELLIPDNQLETKELQALLLDGIARLPAQQQAVFRLSRLEGKSYQEISESLGISKSTVKWHIIAAIASFKEYIHQRNLYFFLFAYIHQLLKK